MNYCNACGISTCLLPWHFYYQDRYNDDAIEPALVETKVEFQDTIPQIEDPYEILME